MKKIRSELGRGAWLLFRRHAGKRLRRLAARLGGGGLMVTYPLLIEGNATSRARVFRNFDFVFSELVDPNALRDGKLDAIINNVRKFVEAVRTARGLTATNVREALICCSYV